MAFALPRGPLQNDFDPSSDEVNNPLTHGSETFAAYLDLGYQFALIRSLDGYLGLGLGYYRSCLEDHEQDGFLATER